MHLAVDHATDAICAEIREHRGEVSDENLAKLNFLHSLMLPPALEMIDKGFVTEITSKGSRRTVLSVQESSGLEYYCFGKHCTCPEFASAYLSGERARYLCKHMLAADIAQAANKCSSKEVDDSAFVREIPNLLGDIHTNNPSNRNPLS